MVRLTLTYDDTVESVVGAGMGSFVAAVGGDVSRTIERFEEG